MSLNPVCTCIKKKSTKFPSSYPHDGTRISDHDRKANSDAVAIGKLYETPYGLATNLLPAISSKAGCVPLLALLELWIPTMFDLFPPEIWSIVFGYGLTDFYRCLQCQFNAVIVIVNHDTHETDMSLNRLTRVCALGESEIGLFPTRCKSLTCSRRCGSQRNVNDRGYRTVLSRQLRCTCGRRLYQFACSYDN